MDGGAGADTAELERVIADAKRRARGDLKLPVAWMRQGYAWDGGAVLVEPACHGTLAREHAESLSVENFARHYDAAALPCVIDGCAETWRASRGAWTPAELNAALGRRRVKCGEDDDGCPVRIELRAFLAYMGSQRDDSPIYVFDSMFAGKGSRCSILDDYSVPPFFADDLFALVGEHRRPPYRWFLIGPKRSGTRLHIDPLGTSAWNTLISGRKRWVLFEPGVPADVVKAKAYLRRERGEDDEAIDYFTHILPRIKAAHPEVASRMLEFVQRPGETVFVPGAWWHAVLNLDDSIAVTQNFASTPSFPRVWAEAVRGRRGMARKWLRALRHESPALAAVADAYNAAHGIDLGAQARAHRERKVAQAARRQARRQARVRKAERQARAAAAAAAGAANESDSGGGESSHGCPSLTTSSSSGSSSGSVTSSSCSDGGEEARAAAERRRRNPAPAPCRPVSADCVDEEAATVGCGEAQAAAPTERPKRRPRCVQDVQSATDRGVEPDDDGEVELTFRAYAAKRRRRRPELPAAGVMLQSGPS